METAVHLDYATRWLRDGLRECGQGGAFEVLLVDVTRASNALQRLKAEGSAVTWTHIFVRAAAMVLERNADLHQVVAGNTRVNAESVDICLSLGGDSSVTPVLVIEDAAHKDLLAIASEVRQRTSEAVRENEIMLKYLRQLGWLLPFSFLRRRLIRFLLGRPAYRRKVSGTFQVTCVPQVDLVTPFLFNTVAALGIGRVCERVIAMDGMPVVRQTVTLSCCFDHAIWNGMAAARFLTGMRDVLESLEFAAGLGPSQTDRFTATQR